jgi:hypothetical protein
MPAQQGSSNMKHATTPEAFQNAVYLARPQERIIYHVGYLAKDRARGSKRFDISEHATAVWVEMLRGRVHLVQYRIGPGCWQYQAIKASPPYKKGVSNEVPVGHVVRQCHAMPVYRRGNDGGAGTFTPSTAPAAAVTSPDTSPETQTDDEPYSNNL